MVPGVSCDVVMNAYTEFCLYGSLHSPAMLECEAPIFSVENKRMTTYSDEFIPKIFK